MVDDLNGEIQIDEKTLFIPAENENQREILEKLFKHLQQYMPENWDNLSRDQVDGMLRIYVQIQKLRIRIGNQIEAAKRFNKEASNFAESTPTLLAKFFIAVVSPVFS